MKPRLRALDETDCYARCYGDRDGTVRVVKAEPRRPRYELKISGEALRQRFEKRMGERETA